MKKYRIFLLLLGLALLFVTTQAQEGSGEASEEGSAEGLVPVAEDEAATAEGEDEAAAAEGEAEEAAAEGEAEPEDPADGDSSAAEEEGGSGEEEGAEEGEEDCEEEEGSGDGSGDIEAILALGSKKCKSKADDADGSGDEEDLNGADALAASLETCDMDGMDEKLASCLQVQDTRLQTLEQAVLSGEGGGLEDQITLVLVKKGVIDCENDTQCADDRACIESYVEPGRDLCELPCERTQCPVPYSECVTIDHQASCECNEGFHGNGTVACVPDGFSEEENGKHYKMFDDIYVEFDNASATCQEMGARLPVLDSPETITTVKKYLEESNFTVFEQWDRSSRRVWLGLVMDRGSGLVWADGARVLNYPESSRLFVWEARRILSQEVTYADNSRHYAFYIDGDIAKLPGGGRKGAAVLCELIPSEIREPQPADPYDPYAQQRETYSQQQYYQQQQRPQYPSDGGYPNYPQRNY